MTIIASNDSVPSDSLPLSFIDNNFIDRLKQLDKVSTFKNDQIKRVINKMTFSSA